MLYLASYGLVSEVAATLRFEKDSLQAVVILQADQAGRLGVFRVRLDGRCLLGSRSDDDVTTRVFAL